MLVPEYQENYQAVETYDHYITRTINILPGLNMNCAHQDDKACKITGEPCMEPFCLKREIACEGGWSQECKGFVKSPIIVELKDGARKKKRLLVLCGNCYRAKTLKWLKETGKANISLSDLQVIFQPDPVKQKGRQTRLTL